MKARPSGQPSCAEEIPKFGTTYSPLAHAASSIAVERIGA
jgi:hypothetical protein